MPRRRTSRLLASASVLVVLVVAAPVMAQDRIKSMPGYDRYQSISRQIPNSVKRGSLTVTWKDGGKAFEYRKDGKSYRYDIAAKKAIEAEPTAGGEEPGGRFRRGGGGVERGRQLETVASPNGKLKAFHRSRDLWLGDSDGAIETRITTDGSQEGRIKSGIASWVYGEELDQNSAIWWSPDSKKVAFYRFDEGKVKDYFIGLDQLKLQSTVDAEPYPKAGTPNPVADLYVYDLASKKATKLDVRSGKPFEDEVVGHYVYNVRWSPDGKELLFHRTNRRQDVMELVAADPSTGSVRTVVREEWHPSWVENNPTVRFLADGRRFLWESERTGWKNYDLYDLSGKRLAAVTDHRFEVGAIVRIDEAKGTLDYMARSGDNHMKLQLHRVGLDGKDDRRITDPSMNHDVNVAPDGAHLIDVAQTHDQPPVTRLLDDSGNVIEELATSDLSAFDKIGLKRAELFSFKAADGKTELHGLLHKPSDFDPNRRYPLLVSVYAGPATNGARETFTLPNALTEYGLLVASLDSRSAAGKGKEALDAFYMKFGQVEIDDQAAGVKALRERPYVDGGRVGIFGTSYGGTASALCLLRYPDVFQAAAASSAVTDFRNYDTIYTERYMRTPAENAAGYDAASSMTYAGALKGRLMLFFGTADNNVHPSNTLQLIQALQRAGKSFEVQVGPDMGHAGLRQDRMMEFFIEGLVLPKSTKDLVHAP